jgi:hypothetical protein
MVIKCPWDHGVAILLKQGDEFDPSWRRDAKKWEMPPLFERSVRDSVGADEIRSRLRWRV